MLHHHPKMLQIEAIQTVMPTKSTDPKTSSNITVVPQDLNNSTIFLQRRFNIVLCYNKSCDEDSGWIVAGWIKESLGRALAEQPVFAGRVRRQSEESGDLFVVSDDSGVRLVEGKAEMKLDDLKSKGQIETELVFWEDVFQQNPRFSPLFYVQVTNFSCGGYSIGISCSLLLADPFVLTTFLNNWSNLHNEIVSKPNLPKIPLFYLPNLAKPGSSSPYSLMGQTTSKSAAAQSIIFTIPTNILNSDNNINYNYNDIVALCIDKAEHEVGTKMASKFSLFVKLPPEDFKVEIMSREKLSSIIDNLNGLSCGKIWDEVIKVDEICFGLGNKPEYASCWINKSIVDDEGFVLIIASDDLNTLGMKIVVTFP